MNTTKPAGARARIAKAAKRDDRDYPDMWSLVSLRRTKVGLIMGQTIRSGELMHCVSYTQEDGTGASEWVPTEELQAPDVKNFSEMVGYYDSGCRLIDSLFDQPDMKRARFSKTSKGCVFKMIAGVAIAMAEHKKPDVAELERVLLDVVKRSGCSKKEAEEGRRIISDHLTAA